jgi:hypothetical protein
LSYDKLLAEVKRELKFYLEKDSKNTLFTQPFTQVPKHPPHTTHNELIFFFSSGFQYLLQLMIQQKNLFVKMADLYKTLTISSVNIVEIPEHSSPRSRLSRSFSPPSLRNTSGPTIPKRTFSMAEVPTTRATRSELFSAAPPLPPKDKVVVGKKRQISISIFFPFFFFELIERVFFANNNANNNNNKKKDSFRRKQVLSSVNIPSVPLGIEIIDRLTILRPIGSGSFGQVFQADWDGTEVAIKKTIRNDENLHREAATLSRLKHPVSNFFPFLLLLLLLLLFLLFVVCERGENRTLFNFWDCITQNRRCTSSRSIFQWEICSIC